MRNWIHKIKIRDISEDKNYNNDLLFLKQKRNYGLEMYNRLKKYPFIPLTLAEAFKRIKTLKGFNSELNYLYDFCDLNDIWVEF